MPFTYTEEDSQSIEPSQTFTLPAETAKKYSQPQEDKIALAAALAEKNLKSDEVDTGAVYSSNKDALSNGQEQSIRDNISALEKQNTLNANLKLFVESSEDGDTSTATGALLAAREAKVSEYKDALEFNSLDSFRVDGEEADAELMDNTQAVMASSMISNQNDDANAQLGILDKIQQKYVDLQHSAQEHGNTLKTDVLKGIVNGVPRAMEGIADNINKLLPKGYWDLLSKEGENPDALRNYVMKQVEKDTLGKLDVGTVGKVTEDISAFVVAMSTVGRIAPSLAIETSAGFTALNGVRAMASATIADSAIFDGMDSAIKSLTTTFPSTENVVTSWLGDRNEKSPWENKAKQALEAVGLNSIAEGAVFGLLKGYKGLKNLKTANAPLEDAVKDPIKSITLTGDRETAGSITQKKLSGSEELSPIVDQVTTMAQSVENTLPSILKTPLDVKPEVSLMGIVDVHEARARTLQKMKQIDAIAYTTNRLNASEMDLAVSSYREQIEGLYPDHKVIDVSVNKENGVNVGNITLGQNGTGGGYKTEEIARNQTEGLDVSIVKQPNGEFFAVHKRGVKEAGFVDQIDFTDTSVLIKNAVGRIGLQPAEYLPDHILQDIGLAANSKTRIRNSLVNPLMDTYFKGVSKEDFVKVNEIAALGRDSVIDAEGRTGKWFNQEEFDVTYDRIQGKGSKAKAWESYKAYRELNDLQYSVENRNEYVRKVRAGMEEVSMEFPEFSFRGNATIKETLQATDTFRTYLPEENKVLARGEIRANNLQEKYKDYRVIQLEDAHAIDTGEPIKYLLVNPSDFKANMIDPIQVSYRAGGRVVYASKYFSKQAVTKTLESGDTINLNPLTHYTGESRQELVLHTRKLEDARNAYKSAMEVGKDGGKITYYPVEGIKKDGTFTYARKGKVLTVQEADNIISKTAMVDTGGMAKYVEEGSFGLDHPLEVRGDREIPVSYNPNGQSYIDENHSGATTWLRSNKKSKFAARGERLLNPQEQAAKVLDPHQAIERSINSIVNYGLAGDYTTRISEQFTATAKAMGFLKPEFKDASAARVYSAGKDALQPSITGRADTDYQGLLATLEATQRGLGFKSATSLMKDAQLQRFAEHLESSAGSLAPIGSTTRKATDVVVSLSDKDPLQAANSFLYYTQFGMNAMQFVTQGVGGYVTTALQDPLKATQAVMGASYRTLGFLRKDIPTALSKNSKLMKLMGFDDGADYLKYNEVLQKSGYVDVLNTQIDMARQKMNTGRRGTAFDILDKAISKSTIAMETGEMLNQEITFRVAYMRFKELYPKADTNSSQSVGWIVREADKIGVNMKSAVQRQVSKNPVLWKLTLLAVRELRLRRQLSGVQVQLCSV